MSVTAFLLRLLLCLGLLANGSAQAVAAEHLGVAARVVSHATPRCHEAGPAPAAMANRPTFQPAGNGPSKKPDCCKSAACGCTCSDTSAATLSTVGGQSPRMAGPAPFGPLPAAYASPALPRRVRPPIV